MTSPSALARLLRPRSIAVVGGGPWCEAVLDQCRRMRFAGPVHAVHPYRETVGGYRAWPDVADLPAAPDAAFVGVNREASIDVVRALAARGAGGAVCFANGFAESGAAEDAHGADATGNADNAGDTDGAGDTDSVNGTDGASLQRRLLEAAGELALLGPNCYGFVNALDGAALWPDQHGCEPIARGVAVVTQSSNIALNLSMQRRGLPLACLVTSGNQAQQGFAAIGRTLLEDERVSALGLHVEGFGDVRAFEALAAFAARLGKPLVVLKAGRSVAARRATLTHTASLAGSEAGADALLARLGVARVASLPALVETLKLAHVHGAAPLARVDADGVRVVHLASLSCSGGEAALVADAADASDGTGAPSTSRPVPEGSREGRRLEGTSADDGAPPRLVFPPPDDVRRRALADALGPRVAIANPLDYDTGIWRDGRALERVYAAAGGDDVDLTLLVLDLPRDDRCDASDWTLPIEALERVARTTGHRCAVIASLPENLPEALARRLIDAGIAPLAGIDDALAAVRALATLDGRAAAHDYLPVLLATPIDTAAETDTSVSLRERPTDIPFVPTDRQAEHRAGAGAGDEVGKPAALPEALAKTLLSDHGVVVPCGARASSPTGAVAAAGSLGFPVVLKGEGFAHKSEAGAVALGLADADAVERAARAMPCERFLVEEMIGDGVVELLIGVVRDPAHGFVLTLGAGGVLTDVLADRVSTLLPVTGERIENLLARLRVGRIVAGVRGRAGADRPSIVGAVLAVQALVLARADDLLELEINPLLCRTGDAVALDALLVSTRPVSP